MLHFTIPYGRNLNITYYGDDIVSFEPRLILSTNILDIFLPKGKEYDNLRNTWVAITIANRLQQDERAFQGVLIPKDDIFIITSAAGDVLRFKLYNDVLVAL